METDRKCCICGKKYPERWMMRIYTGRVHWFCWDCYKKGHGEPQTEVETVSCAECKHRPIGAEICEEPCHYEPQTDWHYDEQDATWYPYKHEDEPQTEKPKIRKRIDKPFRAVWLDDDHNEIGTTQTERGARDD